MTDGVKVVTNNVPRDILNAWDLTPRERERVGITDATDDGEYFRYRGEVYAVADFSADFGITRGAGLPPALSRWDGYLSESAFSALVIRYVDDFERVIVGLVLS